MATSDGSDQNENTFARSIPEALSLVEEML